MTESLKNKIKYLQVCRFRPLVLGTLLDTGSTAPDPSLPYCPLGPHPAVALGGPGSAGSSGGRKSKNRNRDKPIIEAASMMPQCLGLGNNQDGGAVTLGFTSTREVDCG